MSELILISILNFIYLVLAQLNVWRPISFKKLEWANASFSFLVVCVLVTIVLVKWVRQHGTPPTAQDIHDTIYSTDYVNKVRMEFRVNLAAFVLHEILAVITTLILYII